MWASMAQAQNIQTMQPGKVSLQLSAEKWATTKSAKVIVGINATLNDTQLTSIHSDILQKLKKIVPNADWHITEFNRNKNQSGLEQLMAAATARVPENELSNLRKNAKAVSKPGESYTIRTIEYSPSLKEIETVEANLRNEIYQEAKQELTRLNKVYPEEHFFLQDINFNGNLIVPKPQPASMMFAKVATSAAMSVSQKITLNAVVTLASTANMK